MATLRNSKGPSPEKAQEILADGTVRGKKITSKQVRFFHAIVGAKKRRKSSP